MDNLIEQLIRDEELRLEPYRDSRGFLTIGIGHNLDAKPMSRRAVIVQCEDDIADAKSGLMGKWPWMRDLSAPRLAAFINLAFNMGVGGLGTFKKALKAAQEGRWEDCAAEIMDSDYAKQVGPRAHRVSTQLKEDRWV